MPSVQVGITDTNDDVSEAVGFGLDPNVTLAGATGGLVADAGLRFQALTGPGQGATISSATLTLNIVSVGGTPNTTFYGVDVDDAAAWADPGNLPSAAARTTASVAGPTATGTQVLDVTAIVQEIVNRAGWVSGNDIAFVAIDNAGSGENTWFGEDYGDAGTAHALLDVTYVGASGQPATKRAGGIPWMGAHGAGFSSAARRWIVRTPPAFATNLLRRATDGQY